MTQTRRSLGRVAELRGTVGGLGSAVAGLNGMVAGLSEIVAGHDRKPDDLAAGLSSLRDAVTHYDTSVLGHGLLIRELDHRVRRIERHFKLGPAPG